MDEKSRFVGCCLDSLGYSAKTIKHRKRVYSYIGKGIKVFEKHGYAIHTYCDAIASPFDEDNFNVVLKTNIVFDIQGTLVAVTNEEHVPPGFAFLWAVIARFVDESFVNQITVNDFLNSPVFQNLSGHLGRFVCGRKYYTHMNSHWETILSRGVHIGRYKTSFACILNMGILPEVFESRDRQGWPPAETVMALKSTTSYLFPAEKDDDNVWEIRQTEAEQVLVNSLNNTQLKVLVLLRMICNSELGQISPKMDSYLMKNIVFWMAESCPESVFRPEYLLFLLMTSITMLYNGIKLGRIPCYLNPKRNLAFGLDIETKYRLLQKLTQLQQEKACMVLRVEKLKHVMLAKFASPEKVLSYQGQRDQIEIMVLMLNLIRTATNRISKDYERYTSLLEENETVEEVLYKLEQMLMPERYTSLLEENETVENVLKQMMKPKLNTGCKVLRDRLSVILG